MQPFDYIVPQDFAEASALLADSDPQKTSGPGIVRPFQGGTDLLIRMRSGFIRPARVVDLKNLPGMREIWRNSEGWLVIGAACTMNQVAAHSLVQHDYGLLAQACNSVASYQLRNRATVGGNCCNASPAADTAPALYCLDAVAEIYGSSGIRRLPIAEFFVGPGRTVLQPGEFLTGLHLPPSPIGARGVFNKLGRTKVGDISIVSVAVYAWPVSDSEMRGRGEAETVTASLHHRAALSQLRWRIALGAVGPTPLRAPDAETALTADSSPAGVVRAADLAAEAARPIDDIRASASYRKAMVRVLARRGITAVLEILNTRSPQQAEAPGVMGDGK